MTAIAFDGKTMAADSRCTCGSMIFNDTAVKLHRVSHTRWDSGPAIVGCAGEYFAIPQVLAWLQGGDSPPEGVEWSVLVWDGKTARTISESTPIPMEWGRGPVSIGSGKEAALAAMRAGSDAGKAVEVAITMDVYCGGQIRTMQLDENEQVPHSTPAGQPYSPHAASTILGDVTSEDINRAMRTGEYHDCWGKTICRVTLFNGYVVTGTSLSGHDDNLKRMQALQDAERQVKQLLDFLLHSQHAAVETGGWQLDNGPRQRGHYDLAQLVANTHPNHFQTV